MANMKEVYDHLIIINLYLDKSEWMKLTYLLSTTFSCFIEHNKISKFQVQDSDLEYLIWQSDKRIILSEKKPPLVLIK